MSRKSDGARVREFSAGRRERAERTRDVVSGKGKKGCAVIGAILIGAWIGLVLGGVVAVARAAVSLVN